jgi:putative SbcD/Mre11-related phosphoesterase
MRLLDDWLLTAGRVAIHLPTATAVAADLHLGYDRVRRRRGDALPVRTFAAELAPLRKTLQQHGVRRLIVAGDLFEDARHQREEMVEELERWLAESDIDLIAVVQGNHDQGLGKSRLPVHREAVPLGDWLVVHGDQELPSGSLSAMQGISSGSLSGRVVQGHEHPWMRWRSGVEGPCYLAAPGHLVLPAWSPDAAGVNVLGNPRWAHHRCCVIAGEQIIDFGEVGSIRKA